MKSIFQVILILFLLLVTPAFADMAIPLSWDTIPYLPIVILIEILVFWFLVKKAFKKELNIKKIIMVVLLANLASSFFGLFIYFSDIFSYFIVSVIIEFLVFFIFLRKSFKLINLLAICIVINIFSYIFLFFTLNLPRPPKGVTLEAVKNNACQMLISIGCNSDTNSIVVKNFDADKNGLINDDGDTLFALCKNWYDIKTDSDCKTKVCNCPP